jgi:hypothetical protein
MHTKEVNAKKETNLGLKIKKQFLILNFCGSILSLKGLGHEIRIELKR